MCTYEPAGKNYSLDNGVPVPKKLPIELTESSREASGTLTARTHRSRPHAYRSLR